MQVKELYDEGWATPDEHQATEAFEGINEVVSDNLRLQGKIEILDRHGESQTGKRYMDGIKIRKLE